MKVDGMRIETIMAEQQITKVDLSRRCGVSQQNICTIVKRGTCATKTAGKLAGGLGVPVSDILARED